MTNSVKPDSARFAKIKTIFRILEFQFVTQIQVNGKSV